jgi:hypothetical protein
MSWCGNKNGAGEGVHAGAKVCLSIHAALSLRGKASRLPRPLYFAPAKLRAARHHSLAAMFAIGAAVAHALLAHFSFMHAGGSHFPAPRRCPNSDTMAADFDVDL